MAPSVVIAVSGASGFIGKAVAAHLGAQGEQVRVLARPGTPPPTDADWRLLPAFDAPDGGFDHALEGASLVVHCAALNSDQGNGSPDAFTEANALLTRRLAEAAANEPGCGFVFLSSIRAVADPDRDVVIGADTVPHPQAAYGRSKLAGEEAVRQAFAGISGRHAAILRLPPVYGPGMSGLLALLLRMARTRLPLPLGGLPGRRPLVGRDGVLRALDLIRRLPPAPVRTLVVADGAGLTPAEIVGAFRAGLGRAPRIVPLPWRILRRALPLGAVRELCADQRCDASAIEKLGWRGDDPREALARLTAGTRKG